VRLEEGMEGRRRSWLFVKPEQTHEEVHSSRCLFLGAQLYDVLDWSLNRYEVRESFQLNSADFRVCAYSLRGTRARQRDACCDASMKL